MVTLRYPPLLEIPALYADEFKWLRDDIRMEMIHEVQRIASDFIQIAPRVAFATIGTLHDIQLVDRYHSTVGMSVRNHYGLWHDSILTERWRNDPATHDIRNGIDYSADHPDAISALILKEIWTQLKA